MKHYLLTALLAFVLSLLLTAVSVPVLRRLKAGQNILSFVEEHKRKSGTPTMGGVGFIFSTLLATAFLLQKIDRVTLLTLAVGLAYGCVGLIDDLLKIFHKENLGLRAWQKLVFQLAIALFVGAYCMRSGLTELYIPFVKRNIDIGKWILPVVSFVFLGTVNAVNLTDGLDGLASAVSLPFFTAMGVLIALQGGNNGVAVVAFALVGALLGFLPFNASPASLFMGDTGSLALGGFAACTGVFTGNALYIAVLGLPFVASVLSVVIQVVYFKASKGKRVFLMSPLHHHFQRKGYSETKIAYSYFAVTLFIAVVCIVTAV